jgi:DNA-binding LacI/PurR family transcriptional regulator
MTLQATLNEGGVKYRQLGESLRRQILAGTLPAGSLLASERRLTVDYGVSRHTVREALADLERNGLVVREQGRGTVVRIPSAKLASPGAKGLREIGIVTAGFDEQISTPIIRGLESRIRQDGYHLLLANCEDGWGSNLPQVMNLLQKGVEGLAIYPLNNSIQERAYQFLEQTDVPFVFVDNVVPGVDADCVTTDNFTGAYEGTKALVAAGCRRIAYLCGPFAAWTARERLSGCQKALWEAGLELDRSLIFEHSFIKTEGPETARRLAARDEGIDGIFIANHPFAEVLFEVLHEHPGCAVAKARMCVFDTPSSPWLSEFQPIIVKQPTRAIGEKAGELLVGRIAARAAGRPKLPGRHISIAPEMVVGRQMTQSTAKSPRKHKAREHAK